MSINDLDILSTVALALAVLSFTAQLIITMAQSNQTSQVNADTKSALAEMRATTSSLLTNQRNQFDKVLHAALSTAIPAAMQDLENENTDPEIDDINLGQLGQQLEARILSKFQDALPPSHTAAVPQGEPARLTSDRSDERDPELPGLLYSYPPEEEGRAVHEVMKSMDAREIAMLSKVATQLHRSRRVDRTVRFTHSKSGPNPDLQRLIEMGFLNVVEEHTDPPRRVLQVTPTGITAIRILGGKGPRPEWLARKNGNSGSHA
ncbi:hypothetical protein ACFYE2_00540 [Kocuria sp. CPCC 205300]|uniref:hypothetical protein n=1 Tax=Kocuria sabuli TaxID=3071448 RepID=UPI0036DB2E97